MKVTVKNNPSITVRDVPNNPSIATINNPPSPSLRLGTVVSNTLNTAIIASEAYNIANLAYTEANSAANTVRISANGQSTVSGLAFANTSTVKVFLTPDGLGNTSLSFVASMGANGNLGVQLVQTGLGLNGGPIETIGTISANVATENTQGVTLLIDSVSSHDTGNAATANAVNAVYSQINSAVSNTLSLDGGTLTGDLTVDTNVYANLISSNTVSLPGMNMTSSLMTTTANGVAVIIDTFPASWYSTFKYLVQVRSASGIYSFEALTVQDGINICTTQFGSVYTESPLGDFEVNTVGANVVLYFTPTNPNNSIMTLTVISQSLIN